LSIALQELLDFLVRFRERQASAPEKLEALEERLSLIEKLKRKYGAGSTEILLYLGQIKKEHEALCFSQERMADLQAEISTQFNDYEARSRELSELRTAGARELEKQVEKEISLLGMKKAKFRIQVQTSSPSLERMETVRESGTEDVEFLISPNPGEDLRPLRKIASGGELSRIMLALKTVGKEAERFKTLIFDEIDSGIGGRTAECIAQKLKKLAERHQVICITHLPQIASFASAHFRIDKKIEKERTFTTVKKLKFEERVSEIARLISGSRITEISLENAREMLAHNLRTEEQNG
jgi:DNA repair protein RecN (Recombination protein N)